MISPEPVTGASKKSVKKKTTAKSSKPDTATATNVDTEPVLLQPGAPLPPPSGCACHDELSELHESCANQSTAKHNVQAESSKRNVEAELSELRQLTCAQQHEISVLRQQLDFVLSFLDIKRTDMSCPVTTGQSEPNVPNHSGSDDDCVGTCGASLWSEVTTRRRRLPKQQGNAGSTQPNSDDGSVQVRPTPRLVPTQTLQQSLLTAVYMDQSSQKRRSSSLIVSGLQQTNSQSDRSLFNQLVLNEFGVQPDITYIKRLGPPLPGKTRPLLVALKSVDQAKHIISSARQLRQSDNPQVRDSVYINPNLTKAEAAAAYRWCWQLGLCYFISIAVVVNRDCREICVIVLEHCRIFFHIVDAGS
jgi:hypothetical protein